MARRGAASAWSYYARTSILLDGIQHSATTSLISCLSDFHPFIAGPHASS